MVKDPAFLWRKRPGVLLLDALMGIAVFSIIVTVISFSLLFSQVGLLSSGDRMRGVFLSERALEAARNIRDGDFADLTEGTFGANIGPAGTLELSGSETVTPDGFTTTVTVTSLASDSFEVIAETSWDFGNNRTGDLQIRTEITDWRSEQPIGDWTSVSLDGAYVDAGTPLFNKAAVNASYAFVTSEISDGGAGLYVFDISNLSAPTRVASAFNLGAAGYSILISGTNLFIATGDSGMEVQVYDISSPSTLSAVDRIATINIPGSGLVRGITLFNDTLYVTATQSSNNELYTYDISDLGAISLLDQLDDTGSMLDIELGQGYAYIASDSDTLELRVVDVFDPSDLQFAPGGGYNLTDVQDAVAVGSYSTYVLLGRLNGDFIDELVLFDVSSSPVPTPPPGPWFFEVGGGVNGLDTEPTGQYGFLASDFTSEEMQVVDLALFIGGQPPQVGSYDTSTGAGRGITYDILHDRTFLLTNTAVIILQPA